MSNVAGRQDDVSSATDKLLKRLLDKAGLQDADDDFALQVVTAATRWTAVKNRMSVPDGEGNAFDGFRDQLNGERGDGGADRSRPSAADDRGADLSPASEPASPAPARSGPPTPRSPSVREARTGSTASATGSAAQPATLDDIGWNALDVKLNGTTSAR